jgi:hypothetical protein
MPILQINPQGYFVFFVLFSTITILLSFIVFGLLCSNRFRRPQWRSGGKLSKLSALLIIVPLAGASLGYWYNESWGYFFTLESEIQTIKIDYYYPTREVTFHKTEIRSIQTTNHTRKSGTQYRLVIQLKNDSEYSSQLINQRDIQNIVVALEKELRDSEVTNIPSCFPSLGHL